MKIASLMRVPGSRRDLERLHGLGDVVHAYDRGAIEHGRTCAAIEPPIRRSGGAGETLSMKRLREAPTRSGSPKALSRPSRAIASMLCSGVLPKPMPGSSTMRSRAMPARAAIAERSREECLDVGHDVDAPDRRPRGYA